MRWYVNPIRKQSIFRYRNLLFKVLHARLHVYWNVNDDKGLGFWNNNKNVEFPLLVSYYELLNQGFEKVK